MPNTYSMVTGVDGPITVRVCCRSCNEYISTPRRYVGNWRIRYNENVYRGGEGTIVPEMVSLQSMYNAYARMLLIYAESTEDGEYVDGNAWKRLSLSPSMQADMPFYIRDLPLVDGLNDYELVEFICENCLDQLRSLDELRNRRTRMVEEVELEPDDPEILGVTSAEQAERVARWNEEAQRTANDVADALAAEMSAPIDASAIDSIRADRIASNSIQADSLVIGQPIPNRWAPRDAGFEPALRFRGRDWNPVEKLRKSDEFFVKVDPGMPKDFAEFVGLREATVTVGIHDLVKGKYKRLRNSSEQRAIRMECARCEHINVIMHVDITAICSHPQTFMDRMRKFITCKCDPVVPEKPVKSGFINRKLRKPKQR